MGERLYLFGDTGYLTCLEAATGKPIWQEKVSDRFFGSPVCVGGRIYCISRTGTVYVVAAAEKYKLLAVNPLGEKSHATPAVAGGRMYLRTYSHLISVGGKKKPATSPRGRSSSSSPSAPTWTKAAGKRGAAGASRRRADVPPGPDRPAWEPARFHR